MVAVVVFCGQSPVAEAAPPSVGSPTVGWRGHYVVGHWTPVTVPVTVSSTTSTHLELTAVDSDGNRVRSLSPTMELQPGENLLTGLVKVGRLDGEINLRVEGLEELRGIPGRSAWLNEPLKPATRLIVVVSQDAEFNPFADQEQSVQAKLVNIRAEELPVDSQAYDGVFSLLLTGSRGVSARQSAALRDWVASGGRLLLSLNQDAEVAQHSVETLADWLPIRVGPQPAIVREFGGLETFAAKNVRVPQSGILSIPSLKFETGEILAASRSEAFLVRAPYGLGTVTVLALDVLSKPLSEWKSLKPFFERMTGIVTSVDAREKLSTKGAQITTTGISDLATQLNATQENFAAVHRHSPWSVMGLLLVLLVIVGPIDYLIVNRLLGKAHLTWLSFPILVVVLFWLTSAWSQSANGSARRANQLDILNVDVSLAKAWGRHFVTLYSPTTSHSSFAVKANPLVKDQQATPTVRATWHGVPETTFGGMLRPVGFEQGATYEQKPDGSLFQLPEIQWGSKALVAEESQSADGLVECRLRSTATGRLTGTITHRFAGPIEDWMIVYRNVVYRSLKKKDDLQSLPLPPHQVWRVEQPSVYSRDLRPYLTGTITMATPRFGESKTTDLVRHETSYDPLSLDPFEILKVLTFHDEIGGERYTHLSNHLLQVEDLSRLHALGRAILFGRLSQPVATIQQDQTELEPDRRMSVVRLILPVTRSNEVLKDLRRVVPDN